MSRTTYLARPTHLRRRRHRARAAVAPPRNGQVPQWALVAMSGLAGISAALMILAAA